MPMTNNRKWKNIVITNRIKEPESLPYENGGEITAKERRSRDRGGHRSFFDQSLPLETPPVLLLPTQPSSSTAPASSNSASAHQILFIPQFSSIGGGLVEEGEDKRPSCSSSQSVAVSTAATIISLIQSSDGSLLPESLNPTSIDICTNFPSSPPQAPSSSTTTSILTSSTNKKPRSLKIVECLDSSSTTHTTASPSSPSTSSWNLILPSHPSVESPSSSSSPSHQGGGDKEISSVVIAASTTTTATKRSFSQHIMEEEDEDEEEAGGHLSWNPDEEQDQSAEEDGKIMRHY
ncbi:unnamed protein product [Lepeophtheirus salmonis]|uniref:(salmon louse) hypothetical protein n=1 Tax=Lepeophtheirus salmonis TaxID=72036 RepID=A0A7R8CFM2_LEPSM|nr:unnamed protein product [Lepeophtheirus salmonis]CAF2807715.1 unnamed protein product [Lepeophtheirus salmonis]